MPKIAIEETIDHLLSRDVRCDCPFTLQLSRPFGRRGERTLEEEPGALAMGGSRERRTPSLRDGLDFGQRAERVLESAANLRWQALPLNTVHVREPAR